jgi:hypothetical protein
MPTDLTDISIAIACIYCMALARSDVLERFDGLSMGLRVSTIGSLASAFAMAASVITAVLLNALSNPPWGSALAPLLAMTICAALAQLTLMISGRFSRPLQLLIRHYFFTLLPLALIISTATQWQVAGAGLLPAALITVINGLLCSLLLQSCVVISKLLAAIPALAASAQDDTRHHAITLTSAALLAFAGIGAAQYW